VIAALLANRPSRNLMKATSNIDTLHSQVIFLKMNGKVTEELTEIWVENDQNAWNKDEFAAVQRILIERLGKLPTQKEVIVKSPKKAALFKFSLIDRITIQMIWFLLALIVILIIVSKILASK
jgi:hypothetical protein